MKRGFTIVEIMIVVAIIALLAAIIIPTLAQSAEFKTAIRDGKVYLTVDDCKEEKHESMFGRSFSLSTCEDTKVLCFEPQVDYKVDFEHYADVDNNGDLYKKEQVPQLTWRECPTP